MITAISVAFVYGCTEEDLPSDTNPDGNKEEEYIDGSSVYLGDPSRLPSNEVSLLSGRVRDTSYNYLDGVNIYFGTNKEYACTTAEGGYFELYYKNNADLTRDAARLLDYVFLDDTQYKYSAVSVNNPEGYNGIFCHVVAVPASSNDNIYFLTNVYGKVTFHNDNVPLPAGYRTRDYTVPAGGGKSVNGDTVVSGVQFIINGNVAETSSRYGFELVGVMPGTKVIIRKQGFTFWTRSGGGVAKIEDDSFIVGIGMDFIEFRGEVIGEIDLLGGIS